VMQRKVPTVFKRRTHSNLSEGKNWISPVALSRRAVRIEFPPPAQHTSARSCPWAARALAKARSTLSSESTSHWQKTEPVAAAAWLQVASLRAKMATATRAVLKSLTVANPSPEAQPVTTADSEESIFMGAPS